VFKNLSYPTVKTVGYGILFVIRFYSRFPPIAHGFNLGKRIDEHCILKYSDPTVETVGYGYTYSCHFYSRFSAYPSV
jgi:hypothetical protein